MDKDEITVFALILGIAVSLCLTFGYSPWPFVCGLALGTLVWFVGIRRI